MIVVAGITGYGNNFYPHGPAISTGDYICENEDRGPCHENTFEDTRRVNVPGWVKFIRKNESGIFLSLMALAIFALYADSKKDEDEQIDTNRQ